MKFIKECWSSLLLWKENTVVGELIERHYRQLQNILWKFLREHQNAEWGKEKSLWKGRYFKLMGVCGLWNCYKWSLWMASGMNIGMVWCGFMWCLNCSNEYLFLKSSDSISDSSSLWSSCKDTFLMIRSFKLNAEHI